MLRSSWDAARVAAGDEGDLVGDDGDLDAYLDDAMVLTDDFAPVDQLILGTR